MRPETLLRWHRHLVTRKAARWGRRRRGRPPIPPDLKALIQGELKKIGNEVSG